MVVKSHCECERRKEDEEKGEKKVGLNEYESKCKKLRQKEGQKSNQLKIKAKIKLFNLIEKFKKKNWIEMIKRNKAIESAKKQKRKIDFLFFFVSSCFN